MQPQNDFRFASIKAVGGCYRSWSGGVCCYLPDGPWKKVEL